MKQMDDVYRKWLERTKQSQPVLEQTDELMKEIFRQILVKERQEEQRKTWKVAGWISTVAAGFLLSLLLNQVLFPSSLSDEIYSPTEESAISPPNVVQEGMGRCLEEKTMSGKGRCLSEIWKKRQQTPSIREYLMEVKRINMNP